MLLVRRADNRRVFVLGAAGLVPAALVTLLLVHQPSIGDRLLYPMLRGPLSLVAYGLALATVIAWAITSNRLSRLSLSGLAWAGVTVLLCIGPFVESKPRDRLFAFELGDGDVAWDDSRAAAGPVLDCDDAASGQDTGSANGCYLVATEVDARSLVGFDPATGVQEWRDEIDDPQEYEAEVAEALAAGAYVPDPSADPRPTVSRDAPGLTVVDGRVEPAGDDDGIPWRLEFPGEDVLAVARSGDSGYAYVSTPGADAPGTDVCDRDPHASHCDPAGAVVRFNATNGDVEWRSALPESMVVQAGAPAIAAVEDTVVVAGGERIGALEAVDGALRWTQNVVALGNSRSYALPGAIQQVVMWDPAGGSEDHSRVFLSALPER
jgi:PQQ-like domain